MQIKYKYSQYKLLDEVVLKYFAHKMPINTAKLWNG